MRIFDSPTKSLDSTIPFEAKFQRSIQPDLIIIAFKFIQNGKTMKEAVNGASQKISHVRNIMKQLKISQSCIKFERSISFAETADEGGEKVIVASSVATEDDEEEEEVKTKKRKLSDQEAANPEKKEQPILKEEVKLLYKFEIELGGMKMVAQYNELLRELFNCKLFPPPKIRYGTAKNVSYNTEMKSITTKIIDEQVKLFEQEAKVTLEAYSLPRYYRSSRRYDNIFNFEVITKFSFKQKKNKIAVNYDDEEDDDENDEDEDDDDGWWPSPLIENKNEEKSNEEEGEDREGKVEGLLFELPSMHLIAYAKVFYEVCSPPPQDSNTTTTATTINWNVHPYQGDDIAAYISDEEEDSVDEEIQQETTTGTNEV